jgi:hypothetical protein
MMKESEILVLRDQLKLHVANLHGLAEAAGAEGLKGYEFSFMNDPNMISLVKNLCSHAEFVESCLKNPPPFAFPAARAQFMQEYQMLSGSAAVSPVVQPRSASLNPGVAGRVGFTPPNPATGTKKLTATEEILKLRGVKSLDELKALAQTKTLDRD